MKKTAATEQSNRFTHRRPYCIRTGFTRRQRRAKTADHFANHQTANFCTVRSFSKAALILFYHNSQKSASVFQKKVPCKTEKFEITDISGIFWKYSVDVGTRYSKKTDFPKKGLDISKRMCYNSITSLHGGYFFAQWSMVTRALLHRNCDPCSRSAVSLGRCTLI